MLFTSYEFVAFLFLVLVLYYVLPGKFQWQFLLFAGYLFYFAAGPTYLLYILTTTVTVWFAACRMEKVRERQTKYLKEHKDKLGKEEKKSYKAKMKSKLWRWLLLMLLLNLGILAVVKYSNFAIVNINRIISAAGGERTLSLRNLVLPMGISFYTFQALGYLIDVYRGTVKAEKNPFRFALFVSFFPQLVQGPISRFGDLSATLFKSHPFQARTVCFGLERVLWGYFKKLVIADRMLVGVNTIIGDTDTYRGAYVFVGMMFYALELYADFTGGIDITIGVAEAMGIRVTENFNRPFFSKSIKEYWRRWHITMGTWFTDYIFYPISVCRPMLKVSKFTRAHFGEQIGKRVPVYLSSFAVWLATGIWHGAGWNFVAWGLGNWIIIMISQEFEPLYEKFHGRFRVEGKTPWKMFQILRTILLMSCLRMFDCYRDVPLTFRMFGSMFTRWDLSIFRDGSMYGLGLSGPDYMVLLAGTVLMIAVSCIQRKGKVREMIAEKPYPVRFVIWYGLFLAVLLLGAYGAGYDASQFIYNQF